MLRLYKKIPVTPVCCAIEEASGADTVSGRQKVSSHTPGEDSQFSTALAAGLAWPKARPPLLAFAEFSEKKLLLPDNSDNFFLPCGYQESVALYFGPQH